jgi:hypothetical protein
MVKNYGKMKKRTHEIPEHLIDFKVLWREGYDFSPEEKVFFVSQNLLDKFVKPQGFEEWKVQSIIPESYFQERIVNEYGITDEENTIELIHEGQKVKEKIFNFNQFGDIEIIQFDLKRNVFTYMEKDGNSNSSTNKTHYELITRYNPWRAELKGHKTHLGTKGTHPQLHPSHIEDFEAKTAKDTLVITEGTFKSFVATKNGINTIGLSSISHFKDKQEETIHTDIIDYIRDCNVNKLVILWDGDCRDISSNQLKEGKDISQRPMNFVLFALRIKSLLRDYFDSKRLDIYFSTIKSERIKNEPKGIDDLICEIPTQLEEIQEDFESIGTRPGKFIHSININTKDGEKKLWKYFCLSSVFEFYNKHKEQIGNRNFIFRKDTYEVKKDLPVIKISAELKNYKRIGVDFYKIQHVPRIQPNGEETAEEVLSPWSKQIIVDDHGKNAINDIEKFNGFVNTPNHTDYRKVINGFWNLYFDVNHELKEGKWQTVEGLIRHIFQDQYYYGLDYIQRIYQEPQKVAPVLCLVSPENQTGKSTFLWMLKLIFKNNMSKISNRDLQDNFNEDWATKLIVYCEETLLEKKEAKETIKDLATSFEIKRKEKNKNSTSVQNYLKFIFCSNNHKNFMRLDKYDDRFWVKRVYPIKQEEKLSKEEFEKRITEEIPHFLKFLQTRDYFGKSNDRNNMGSDVVRTPEFFEVVKNSLSTVHKEIKEGVNDLMFTHEMDVLYMSVNDIKKQFGLRHEQAYIRRVLKEDLGVDVFRNDKNEPVVKSYQIPYVNAEGQSQANSYKGRPFVFKREDFVKEKNQSKKLPHEIEN